MTICFNLMIDIKRDIEILKKLIIDVENLRGHFLGDLATLAAQL